MRKKSRRGKIEADKLLQKQQIIDTLSKQHLEGEDGLVHKRRLREDTTDYDTFILQRDDLTRWVWCEVFDDIDTFIDDNSFCLTEERVTCLACISRERDSDE